MDILTAVLEALQLRATRARARPTTATRAGGAWTRGDDRRDGRPIHRDGRPVEYDMAARDFLL
jgi:hypothetical protein